MNVLVTGTAGFIGFHVTLALLADGHNVVGIDNINNYYDVTLKYSRLQKTGIEQVGIRWNKEIQSQRYTNYCFLKLDLEDKKALLELCRRNKFDVVINLAAQAGVRYSLINPDVYIQSNIVGFLNILEACRYTNVAHLVYASSSSVYGLNEAVPFSIHQDTSHPVSLYAATKKANELMAHSYSYLYKIPTTGLRFFTVYGPWGRPDMACQIFATAILEGKPIAVFNHGKMKRDFTYIDDIVLGIKNVITKPAQPSLLWNGKHPDAATSSAPYRIYNIGNNKPVELLHFIKLLEMYLGKKAIVEMKSLQPGDVKDTWADVDALSRDFNYKPKTTIQDGLQQFTSWYKAYYGMAKPSGVVAQPVS